MHCVIDGFKYAAFERLKGSDKEWFTKVFEEDDLVMIGPS